MTLFRTEKKPALRIDRATGWRLVAAILCLATLSACGAMANGRGWGQDATLTPGWERLGKAAYNAAVAPETWVPAAGALAFQIGHADQNVSSWATKNTPVYGSQENAGQMSNRMLGAAGGLWVASGLAAPSGDTFEEWTVNKIYGFGVEGGTGIVTRGVVGYLKSSTDRTRPNGHDRASFPSAHATGTALFCTQTSKNLEAFGWSDSTLTAARFGLGALTAATAWARVEANQHYPSDVLGGIAIGHFFGAFLTDAFLGLDNPRHALILFEPSREGAVAMVRLGF